MKIYIGKEQAHFALRALMNNAERVTAAMTTVRTIAGEGHPTHAALDRLRTELLMAASMIDQALDREARKADG